MYQEKKPIEIAQEAARKVRLKFQGALEQAQDTIKNMNFQDKLEEFKSDLEERREQIANTSN